MKIDLVSIKSRLQKEKSRLTDEISKLAVSKSPETERSGSWFGQRDEQANQTIELRQRLSSEEHLNALLAQVNHALQKLKTGSYGFCDNCGKSINLARLDALPYANLCLNCKAQSEE